MRSRLASPVGRWGLVVLLMSGAGQWALAQPAAESVRTAAPPTASAPDSLAAVPASAPTFRWVWVLLSGVALGVLGARLWARARPGAGTAVASAVATVPGAAAAPVPRAKAENVVRQPGGQPPREVTDAAAAPAPKTSSRQPGTGGRAKSKSKDNPSASRSSSWPANVPHRSLSMNPTKPPVPPAPADQPLATGQTVEWPIPASTPAAIQELIEATASEVPTAPAPAATGPLHYYAPAPDVPSIEHRKLSPNPLPQMPLLITLPHAEATTAQFSFSPQADQSRIIGNGVRELKEFFAFELPPTEQFTAISNLAPGTLEKRDDAWHVVQKAGIALS